MKVSLSVSLYMILPEVGNREIHDVLVLLYNFSLVPWYKATCVLLYYDNVNLLGLC